MAKKASYLDNLVKEFRQLSKAEDRRLQASDKAKYGVMGVKKPEYQKQASYASKSKDKAMGQLFGAILQGRRYDNKTGAQIVKKAETKKLYTVPKKTATKKAK